MNYKKNYINSNFNGFQRNSCDARKKPPSSTPANDVSKTQLADETNSQKLEDYIATRKMNFPKPQQEIVTTNDDPANHVKYIQRSNMKRFDRTYNTRFTFNRRKTHRFKNFRKRPRKVNSNNTSGESNERVGKVLQPFCGTSQLFDKTESEHSEVDCYDDEWNDYNVSNDCHKPAPMPNALMALISAYDSSDEVEDDATANQDVLNCVKNDDKSTVATTNHVDFCTKRLRKGSKDKIVKKRNCEGIKKKRTKYEAVSKFKKRKTTLVEYLLKDEIIHERNVVLQCIRFITKNNFFDK